MSTTRRIKRPNMHAQRVALADAYFTQHPTATVFTRDATPLERKQFGLPPGSTCLVAKMPFGYAHAYASPPSEMN